MHTYFFVTFDVFEKLLKTSSGQLPHLTLLLSSISPREICWVRELESMIFLSLYSVTVSSSEIDVKYSSHPELVSLETDFFHASQIGCKALNSLEREFSIFVVVVLFFVIGVMWQNLEYCSPMYKLFF